MRRPSRSAAPSRAVAIGLALLAHMLLFLLLLYNDDSPPRIETPVQFISLWPQMKPTPVPEDPPPPSDAPSRANVIAPAPAQESTAITVPAPPQQIDWQREATSAARRQATHPEGPQTFSPPAETTRQPCKLPKSSLEWNPETPRAGFTRTLIPLPFVSLGKRCVVGLGFFGCTLGELPKANSHLFDDLAEGKTGMSSVADPHICD